MPGQVRGLVVSLPMRDGNKAFILDTGGSPRVVSLPMRDGNCGLGVCIIARM